MKKIVAFIVTSVLGISGFTQRKIDVSKIEQYINDAIRQRKLPSVSMAIAKDGKIIYEKALGWADIEKKIPATIHTAYQLASLSKPITATAILTLVHNELLDLQSPAERYIHPLRFQAMEKQPSTVRLTHLLNHTAGLGTYFDIGYADEKWPKNSFKDGFLRFGRLFHSPGLISEYSNLGYGVLDMIIANATHRSFSEAMRRRIFARLKMNNSFVLTDGSTHPGLAEAYDQNLEKLPRILNNTAGAGNICSSIHDLILFGMFQLKNKVRGQLPILSDTEIDHMHYFRDSNAIFHYYDSTFYTLGWYYKPDDDGYKILWHEGGMMGASAIIKLWPEENLVVAVITNTYQRELCNQITNDLSALMLPAYHPLALNEENEVSQYRAYTYDSSFCGSWKGYIQVDSLRVPCRLLLDRAGTATIRYLDYTLSSFFTQNQPIFHQTVLNAAIVNKNSFIGMFPGTLPSSSLRRELSHLISLKLVRNGNQLSGTAVALAAAPREYYAYPFYMQLTRQ